MKEFNDMDKAFRDGLGSFEATPPPVVWNGVKSAILTKQIAVLTQRVTIYRRIAAAVGVLLLFSASSQFLPSNYFVSKTTTEVNPFTPKTDTIYVNNTITKYDTVYIDRVNFVERIVYQDNAKTIDNQEVVNEIAEEKIASQLPLNTKNIANNITLPEIKNENEIAKSKEVVADEIAETLEQIAINSINQKEAKQLKINPKFPKINYQLPFDNIRELFRREQPKLSFAERLSVQGLAGLSANQLIAKNTSPQGRFLGGYSADVLGNIYLGNGWNLKTGVAMDEVKFAVNVPKKQVIYAEGLNGAPSFIYRTPFGNSVINNESLSSKPKIGDNITVESENENKIKFWRIPFSLSYDFLDRDVKIIGGFRNIKVYALAGGYLGIPFSQRINVEIYEADGHDFYTTLADFKGLSNLSFGGNLGIGSKIHLGQKISFLGEATIYRNATYLVNNEFFQSIPQGGRLSFGLSYDLK